MGGGGYSGDVSSRSSYKEARSRVVPRESDDPYKIHASLDPRAKKGGLRECCDLVDRTARPIALVYDITESRLKDVKELWKRFPRVMGDLISAGLLTGGFPTISFAFFGDATCDRVVLQVGQFEADERLDTNLLNANIREGGGGGTGQESAELAAYYYARHTKLDCWKRNEKGMLFFTSDEGLYPTVSAAEVKRWIHGAQIDADIPTKETFAELQKLYHVFFIYPQKPWKEKKKDIDAEIKKRVQEAGGQYDDVDIRASLLWDNRNDLDLHVLTPSRNHIFFANRHSRCGGELDVDRNVNGETTKPVENIRWKKGSAPPGCYEVWVENYRYHESSHAAVPFRAEIEINGEIHHINGETPAGQIHTRVPVMTFDYDPDERKKADTDTKDIYTAYGDDVVKDQWAEVIPRDHILVIEDPNGVVDVTLGAIGLTEGTHDLDKLDAYLDRKGQTEKRREQVRRALEPLAVSLSLVRVDVGSLSAPTSNKPRPKRTKRL